MKNRYRCRLLGTTILAIVGACIALYALLVERTRVQIDRFTLQIDKPGLPPEGVTVLHLSDFHFRGSGHVQARKVARLRRLLAQERYGLVALTGDLLHDIPGLPVALALVETLKPRFGAFSCPGNHDYREYSVWGVFEQTWQEGKSSSAPGIADAKEIARRLLDFVRKVLRNELVRLPVADNDVPAAHVQLRARGVEPLVNRAVHVQAGEMDLWVAGIDDLTEGQPDLASAIASVPESAPLILLSHNPDVWLDPQVERADLVLSGHTHGGQIRLPLVGAVHTQGTHLTRRRPAGWFRRGQTHMFVSRGLGESIPLRFGVRPQAALIRLIPSP
jgi:predicted MPP superfamily phosphohydrolase